MDTTQTHKKLTKTRRKKMSRGSRVKQNFSRGELHLALKDELTEIELINN